MDWYLVPTPRGLAPPDSSQVRRLPRVAATPLPVTAILLEGREGGLWDDLLPVLRLFEGSVVRLSVIAGESSVKWARSAGFRPDKSACVRAAAARDERALRLLCAWSTSTCLAALREEDEGVLEWALDSGFPWNADAEVLPSSVHPSDQPPRWRCYSALGSSKSDGSESSILHRSIEGALCMENSLTVAVLCGLNTRWLAGVQLFVQFALLLMRGSFNCRLWSQRYPRYCTLHYLFTE